MDFCPVPARNNEIRGEKQAGSWWRDREYFPDMFRQPRGSPSGGRGQIFKFGLADKATDGMTHCNNGAQI
ncbi:hypothetical protein N7513_008838 [Penicillium frequentans]|nr:hypothetical protein N7513_008838 [Penicillium glabrum]